MRHILQRNTQMSASMFSDTATSNVFFLPLKSENVPYGPDMRMPRDVAIVVRTAMSAVYARCTAADLHMSFSRMCGPETYSAQRIDRKR